MEDEAGLPEQGEIVLATVAKIMDHGAYVSLDEYNGIQGFLHISEIAPGWIRSVSKFVKQGEKKVLLVKRVNLERADVDLSLKQVSNDQRKKKLLEAKRFEKSRTLLEGIREKAGLDDGELERLEDGLYDRYDSVYSAFVDVARNGVGVLKGMSLSEGVSDAMEEVCSKIRLPSVEIRGILEISSNRPDGVDIIKKALTGVVQGERGAGVTITYLGAPRYRLSLVSQDFKSAERRLKPVLTQIRRSVESKKGTFKFDREESKKTRE